MSQTDAKSHVTTYSYDDAHRMTQLLSPIGQRWTFAYDAAGDRTRTVTAVGNATPATGDGTVDATYDPLGRQTAIDYSDSTPDVAFSYDALHRTSMTDGAGTETYGYDSADQLTGVSRGTSGFAYSYDANGQVAKRTYPDGTVIDYSHDDDGRTSSVTSGGAATSYSYDAAGNLISTALPAANGYAETRTVDAAGRLTQLANVKGTSVLSQFAVSRDPVGNPTSVTTTRGGTAAAEAYSYDAADRLTKVCYAASCTGAASSIGYNYDPVGNRTSETRLAAPRPAEASVGAITSVGSAGLCASSQTNGNSAVVLSACTGAANQQWTRADDGTLRIGSNCLELPWSVTADGTVARINPCQGTASHQRWTAGDDGTLVSATAGRCLTTNGPAGSALIVSDCTSAAAMRWQSRPARRGRRPVRRGTPRHRRCARRCTAAGTRRGRRWSTWNATR